MKYAQIFYSDVANGPGIRTSLFVSGCTHHCKECFNPCTWDFGFGDDFTPEVEDQIISSLEPEWVDGLTVLGGEPMEPVNQRSLLPFFQKVKEKFPDKPLWIYSGYTYEELLQSKRCHLEGVTEKILELADVLVDGEFEIDKRNISLKYRGSENQRIIDLPATLNALNSRNEGNIIIKMT